MAERKAEVIPVLELNLGRELGRGMSGSVREGLWQGQRVAIKMSSLAGGYGDVPILQREVAVYGVLASLQGDVIPVLVSWGWTWEGAAFFLATSLIEGASLNAVSGSAASLTKLQLGAEARLRRIHALGVAHGDISMENLVVERSPKGEFRVVFLDLGMAHAPASAAEKSADTRALKEVFRSVRQGKCVMFWMHFEKTSSQ